MDEKLLFLINRHWTKPGLDWVMAVASSLDFWLPILVLIGGWVLWRGGARARLCVACIALAVAGSEAAVGPLKRAFHRLRPHQAMAGVRQVDLDRSVRPRLLALGRPLNVRFSPAPEADKAAGISGRSFPSGHTMDNFAAGTMLALCYRRRGWLYLPVAALVGWSRIYVGSHWPTDILVSALLGAGVSLVLAAIIQWAWLQWVGARAPSPFAGPRSIRSAGAG